MATEIERKFLLKNGRWRDHAGTGTLCRQGYFSCGESASVRVRIAGDKANLNIKSTQLTIRRSEYEYPVPMQDAEEMLADFCHGRIIEKTRYLIPQGGHVWEVDVFSGANQGLIVAELELGHEDERFDSPEWLGEEVSDDPRYYNVNLVSHPFSDW